MMIFTASELRAGRSWSNPAPVAKFKPSRIRDARRRMGMTQQELALRLGCARQTVVNYETGAREPSLSVLPRIASILQITIDQLFT